MPLPFPPPIDKTYVNEEMESAKKGLDRQKWLKDIHLSAPGTDWEHVEEENRFRNYKAYLNNIRLKDNTINVAGGMLIGEWKEKGSNNLSGSITCMDFDTISQKLYLVSAGGALWRSDPNGLNWEVVNDQLRFDSHVLEIVYPGNGRSRIICSISGKPYYSDEGLEWRIATGPQLVYGGKVKDFQKLDDGQHLFYLLDEGNLRDVRIYHSSDYGQSYTSLKSFTTSDLDNLSMDIIEEDKKLIIIEQFGQNSSQLHTWTPGMAGTTILTAMSPLGFGSSGRANIKARKTGQTTSLYCYNAEKAFYRSDNMGISWTLVSRLPVQPWAEGIFVSRKIPGLMILAEVEAYVSRNSGASWTKVNEWSEYYNNPITKLHADIMDVEEFDSNDGPFIAIANHGGVNLSYNGMESLFSIAAFNLNVSQYYSVRSYPSNPDYIFAGSQDQGIQRGFDLGEGTMNFTQLFSGDYGHLCFTNSGKSLWTVYPGGWVFYFADPVHQNFPQQSFQLESQTESVWLPPMISSPYSASSVLMAGGKKNGGPGSHILALTISDFGGIKIDEWPFNFAVSGGTVTGMAYNRFFSNVFYVITSNGRFYKSVNSGQSFSDLSHKLADAHYLYGHDILSSRFDPNSLYIAGSGYSNPAVYHSSDGGQSFQALTRGLPPTTVFDLDMDSEEKFIFAATEAGPYVYISALGEWFPLAQGIAPAQTYWSVEYLPLRDKIRFGTYGRGIWDLDLSVLTSLTSTKPQEDIRLYPNPAHDILRLDYSLNTSPRTVMLIDRPGRLLEIYKNGNIPAKIDISQYPNGVYYLIFDIENKRISKKFIKI